MSRRSVTTATITVQLRLPPGAKVPDAITFITNAVARQKASLDHDAKMASLDLHSVRVTLVKRETAYL